MLERVSLWRVARVFFDEPTATHGLKEVSRKAGLAHTSVINHLRVLEREGIVKKESISWGGRKAPAYRASMSDAYKSHRVLDVMDRLRQSGFVDALADEFQPSSIVLFGSASRGEDAEKSDVDIFLHCDGGDINLTRYERQLKRSIQLHFRSDISEMSSELRENIINGIVLYGRLEAGK